MFDKIKPYMAKIMAWLGWLLAAAIALMNYLGSNPPPTSPV